MEVQEYRVEEFFGEGLTVDTNRFAREGFYETGNEGGVSFHNPPFYNVHVHCQRITDVFGALLKVFGEEANVEVSRQNPPSEQHRFFDMATSDIKKLIPAFWPLFKKDGRFNFAVCDNEGHALVLSPDKTIACHAPTSTLGEYHRVLHSLGVPYANPVRQLLLSLHQNVPHTHQTPRDVHGLLSTFAEALEHFSDPNPDQAFQ